MLGGGGQLEQARSRLAFFTLIGPQIKEPIEERQHVGFELFVNLGLAPALAALRRHGEQETGGHAVFLMFTREGAAQDAGLNATGDTDRGVWNKDGARLAGLAVAEEFSAAVNVQPACRVRTVFGACLGVAIEGSEPRGEFIARQ